MITYSLYCLVMVCIAMFLEVRYPGRYWIGIILWLLHPAACQMYVASKTGYFMTLFLGFWLYGATSSSIDIEAIIPFAVISLIILLVRIKNQKQSQILVVTKEATP